MYVCMYVCMILTCMLIFADMLTGVMIFGTKHTGYQISNATISRNIFVRNGATQTSVDHGVS